MKKMFAVFLVSTLFIQPQAKACVPSEIRLLDSISHVVKNEVIPKTIAYLSDSDGKICHETKGIELRVYLDSGKGELLGQTEATVIDGYATFGNLRFNEAGMKRIMITGDRLIPFLSEFFAVGSFGPAAQLRFLRQPKVGMALPGQPWEEQPIVAIEDRWGNLVPRTSDDRLITLHCVSSGIECMLLGMVSAFSQNGIATFTNIHTKEIPKNIALDAKASNLTSAQSDPVQTD